MKPERPATPAGDAFSRQLAGLSAQLRDEGVPPARDLWPDLERALDRAAAGGFASAAARRRPVFGGRWASAALAASVLLVVGLGVLGRGAAPGSAPGGPLAVQTSPASVTGPSEMRLALRAVDVALADLQTALERSPNDPDLSRLVLMIHHSRGRLLRQQAEDGVRHAFHGRN